VQPAILLCTQADMIIVLTFLALNNLRLVQGCLHQCLLMLTSHFSMCGMFLKRTVTCINVVLLHMHFVSKHGV